MGIGDFSSTQTNHKARITMVFPFYTNSREFGLFPRKVERSEEEARAEGVSASNFLRDLMTHIELVTRSMWRRGGGLKA